MMIIERKNETKAEQHMSTIIKAKDIFKVYETTKNIQK